MRKIIFLCLIIFVITKTYSQNYNISFAGTGATTTVDSVKVENLNQGTTLTLSGSDILHLGGVGINDINTIKEIVKVYPNPMQGQAEIAFYAKETGTTQVFIYDINGKVVVNSVAFLTKDLHKYKVSGLKQGMYFINIIGDNYEYTTKLVSQFTSQNEAKLTYLSNKNPLTSHNTLKSTNAIIDMAYTIGDNLRYTGYSGAFTSIVTDIPTSSKTITFTFIASLATLTSTAITSITTNSAISGGNITSDGGDIVTARGICYATTTNPTIANNIVAVGSGTGLFTANLTGLSPGTTYYVRAYATNSVGTAYGNQISFITIPASLPVITTTSVSSITNTTAITGGSISSDGGAFVGVRGVCWSTSPNPTIALSTKTTNGADIGSYTSNIIGLTAGTTYYVRAYATNSIGTAYGNEVSFATTSTGSLATIATSIVSNITSSSAVSGGIISSDGGSAVIMRGICYSPNVNPTIMDSIVQSGTGIGSFNSNINSLISNNTYYVRAFAINSAGIAYGNQQIFTTIFSSQLPVVIISSIEDIKTNSVKISCGVILNGSGNIKSRGICYNLIGNPTKANDTLQSGSGLGFYYPIISNLIPNTKYYIRAYVTDSLGTAYSNQISFTTLKSNFSSTTSNIVYDIDGNGYDTVVIGSQVWLKQNLKTTHYRNGNSITNITNNSQWVNITTEAYSWFNNDSIINKNTYGGLYNFYAVSDPRKLCPIGWHVPSQEEFFTLRSYVVNDGGKLKEANTTHWLSPNTGATNESEFTALAGGMRGNYGGFIELKEYANFWASTSYDSLKGKSFYISYNSTSISNYSLNKNRGNSIRCIKDTGLINTKPIISIKSVSSIDATSSVVNISIAYKGIDSLYSYGVCYSSSPNPSINDSVIKITSSVTSEPYNVAVNLINLNINSTYYVRTFATNMYGTVYGNEIRFATTPQFITPITTNASLITDISANSGCSISNSLGFYVNSVGICYSTSVNPTLQNTYISYGNSIGTFTYSLSGLTPNTTYYVRAYIWNSIGIYYGNQISFTTLQAIPKLTTTFVSSITSNSAIAGGNITSDCGSSVSARGICFALNFNPTTSNTVISCGNGTGSFTANITGLIQNTNYNVRAYAINGIGTAYGNNINFLTIPTITFPIYDIDGNGYDTVQIGSRTWLKQNLKTTRLNDNNYIPNVNDTIVWGGLTTAARCYANNDSLAYSAIYGALYNWYSVSTGKLCPLGWQVPTTEEWTDLTTYLGGANVAGGKLKETGTLHWISPNSGSTNSSNFTALPGGYRYGNNSYNTVNTFGIWWSSTLQYQLFSAYHRFIINNNNNVYSNFQDFRAGISVRCIKTALPALTTDSVISISLNTAVSGGKIISDNGSTITSKGICWDTLANPTKANNYTYDGTGTASFTSNLTGLISSTTYHVRAYACNSSGTAYGNDVSFTTTSTPTAIGQSFQGGIVAYILQPGDSGYSATVTHGIIAAPTNLSSTNYWSTTWNNTGANGAGIGSGNFNTNIIATVLPSQNNAALNCYNLILNGYSDWYLPSKNELNKLFLNKTLIGGFVNGSYWSSTEVDNNNANYQSFTTGNQLVTDKTTSSCNIRPVRSF